MAKIWQLWLIRCNFRGMFVSTQSLNIHTFTNATILFRQKAEKCQIGKNITPIIRNMGQNNYFFIFYWMETLLLIYTASKSS